MKIVPGNAQHIGRRKSQQDEFWFSDVNDKKFIAHGGVLALVADGMGGLEKGGEASRLAARTFGEAYLAKHPEDSIADALLDALNQANNAVCELSRSVDQFNNVGTTLVAAVIAERSLYWLSVGDSRLYLFRNGQLTQFTHDHNYGEILQKQVADGHLTQDIAENDPDRNALTSFVGLPELTQIDRNLRPYALELGDWIVLCSDGLHGSLNEQEIIDELFGGPQEAADSLIQRVLNKNRPQQDNVTVVIMGHQQDGFKSASRKKASDAKAGYLRMILLLCMALTALAGWAVIHLKGIDILSKITTVMSTSFSDTDSAADPTNGRRITELMQQAEADINSGNLIKAGANGNALDKYRQVLELKKDYQPAIKGLQKLSTLLMEQGQQAIQQGNIEKAQAYFVAAGKAQHILDPSNQSNQAQQQLNALRANTTNSMPLINNMGNPTQAPAAPRNEGRNKITRNTSAQPNQ